MFRRRPQPTPDRLLDRVHPLPTHPVDGGTIYVRSAGTPGAEEPDRNAPDRPADLDERADRPVDDARSFGASGLVVEHGTQAGPGDERHAPDASDDADGPGGRSYAERTMTHSLNSRLAMIPVAILASLTIAACGGNDTKEVSEKLQQQGTELQQQGQQLQKDAQQAAEDVQSGERSSEEVRKELEKKTKDITDKAKDTTNDAIDAVKDSDNLPDEAKKALEDAQKQVNATP